VVDDGGDTMKRSSNSASKHLSDRLHKACEETRKENRIRAAAHELLAAIKFTLLTSAPLSSQQEECWSLMRKAVAKAEIP